MDPVLQQKSEMLIESRDIVKKAAFLNFAQMQLLGGMMYMTADQSASKDRIKACNEILKRKTGLLSNMRGIVRLAVVVKMSIDPNPEAYLDKVLDAYEVLTAGKVYRSEYLVLTAIAMVDNAEPKDFERIAQETWALYGQMRAEHPLLTDQNDTTFAALLVIYGQDAHAIMDEMERCYDIISQRGFLFAKDTAQAVSQILALSSKPADEKCARFKELRTMLKEAKCNLRNGPEQAILAAFADIDVPNEQIVNEIVEVEAWLKTQKGMGSVFGVGSQLRRVMACVIVLDAHKNDRATDTTAAASASLASSITTQIVITIIIIITIIAVNTATQAASH